MDIVKICAIGIITAFCYLILKDNKSEIALLIGIVGGCVILLFIINYIANIFGVIDGIVKKAGIPASLFVIICKIIGIAYITDFSASIIEESGLKSLSEKVILAGKIIIMIIALPIITMLFDTIAGILQ